MILSKKYNDVFAGSFVSIRYSERDTNTALREPSFLKLQHYCKFSVKVNTHHWLKIICCSPSCFFIYHLLLIYYLNLFFFVSQVITLEGWVDIMYYVMDAHSFYNFVYFILLIIVSVILYSLSYV